MIWYISVISVSAIWWLTAAACVGSLKCAAVFPDILCKKQHASVAPISFFSALPNSFHCQSLKKTEFCSYFFEVFTNLHRLFNVFTAICPFYFFCHSNLFGLRLFCWQLGARSKKKVAFFLVASCSFVHLFRMKYCINKNEFRWNGDKFKKNLLDTDDNVGNIYSSRARVWERCECKRRRQDVERQKISLPPNYKLCTAPAVGTSWQNQQQQHQRKNSEDKIVLRCTSRSTRTRTPNNFLWLCVRYKLNKH